MKIYNNIGQMVMNKKLNISQSVYQLDVSILSKGIYRVVIDDQTKSIVIE